MIVIESIRGRPVAAGKVEIVERKGIGHPDTMCDSIMDAISVALCAAYREAFGTILHHNIDKGLLAAGSVERHFGGGRIVSPMELIIGDRATFRAAGKEIPVADIAVTAAKDWLRRHLRFVDPERGVNYRVVLSPGSEELSDIFSRQGQVLGANDTSAAVGYYPLTPTEQIVLDLERHLNSRAFKEAFPETGEDVKVMGLRVGKRLEVTVAMPLIARFIGSEEEYFGRKERVLEEIRGFVGRAGGFDKQVVHYNALDERERGLGGVYLTLTGTSSEDADSGQVGRGNRVNGIISVSRPLGTEAAAGKNPVSHVGKIYNVLAHKIAKEIYGSVEGIREVSVLLLSRIGTPIDRPQMASARIIPERGQTLAHVRKQVREVIEREFADIRAFCDDLSRGVYPVC